MIGRDPAGVDHAPAAVVTALRAALAPLGHDLAHSATYPLHDSTLAHAHALARPGRVLCLEVRRDLLADPFTPFAEMTISPAKVARLAAPIAGAACRIWG